MKTRGVSDLVESLQDGEELEQEKNLHTEGITLYSVVAAFLAYKGWKRPSTGNGRRKENAKWRRVYEEKAKDIRKKISSAKSEVDRLNGKIVKLLRRTRGTGSS